MEPEGKICAKNTADVVLFLTNGPDLRIASPCKIDVLYVQSSHVATNKTSFSLSFIKDGHSHSDVTDETGSGERGVGLKQPSVKTLTHHEALSSPFLTLMGPKFPQLITEGSSGN